MQAHYQRYAIRPRFSCPKCQCRHYFYDYPAMPKGYVQCEACGYTANRLEFAEVDLAACISNGPGLK